MKKLADYLRIALVCGCVGTVVAQIVAVLALIFGGNFGPEKRARLLEELVAVENATFGPPHVSTISSASETKSAVLIDERIWSTDEMSLRRRWHVTQAKHLEALPKDLRTRHDQFRADSASFTQLLTQDETIAAGSGLEEVQVTLAVLRPGEAKTQLLLILEDGGLDDVVRIAMATPLNKRGAIFNTFQTPAERERLNEILKAIRESGQNPAGDGPADRRAPGEELP